MKYYFLGGGPLQDSGLPQKRVAIIDKLEYSIAKHICAFKFKLNYKNNEGFHLEREKGVSGKS